MSSWRKPAPPRTTLGLQLQYMQSVQQRRALLRVNGLVDTCFDACITDFSLTRQLGSGETECMRSCAAKYLALSEIVGQSFVAVLAAEQSL